MGSFLKKENAERHAKEFNTRVELYPVRIVEKDLSDNIYEEDEESGDQPSNDDDCWSDEHDTTSEYGGV